MAIIRFNQLPGHVKRQSNLLSRIIRFLLTTMTRNWLQSNLPQFICLKSDRVGITNLIKGNQRYVVFLIFLAISKQSTNILHLNPAVPPVNI